MLRICLLGPFSVERDGQVIGHRAWARPKDRALLKLLALDRGHLVPQDRLLDALWPDLEPVSAANSLHVAVSRLRKLLGPAPLIRRDAAGYTLAATDAVWIDIEEFRRLLGEGREWRRRGAWAPAAQAYRAAVALYRGELFEDDPYEEWALRPREQLREAQLALLEELADCLVRVGAPAEAVDLCERGLTYDRTREGLYVQLMRAHGAAGRVAEALQAYERCRRALAEELGVEPGPAARAAHAQLLGGEGRSEPPLSSDPATVAAVERMVRVARPTRDAMGRLYLPCVGREQELAYLASRLGAAQAGRGQLVLLHGEPGIGKSRVLEELGRLTASRGVRQLAARCYEMERDLPYAPIVDALGNFLLERADPAELPPALGPWGPQLATLLPPLRDLVPDLPRHQALRPDAERAALLAGLTHLLVALSRSTSLALLLDDLHWADASTVRWLHYLARRLDGAPVLIAGTYRGNGVGPDHPLQRLLESLAGDPAVPPALELQCLGVEHVAALLPAVSGSAARGHALAVRLHRETDGHPLFLVETLRTLLETGVLRLDQQGEWEAGGATIPTPERRLPLPSTLREAIRWRVRRLNERERRVLLAATVVARGFRPELLARMTELTPDAVLDTLEALAGRQLVRPAPAGSGFDFRHDLIQQVVYDDLGPDRRRALHARAAEALQAEAEERPLAVREAAGELAHHWRRAERWASAFRYAVLAGDRAREAFAPREALTHYQRAAEIAGHQPALVGPGDRAELLERLGRTHADLGEIDAAIEQVQLRSIELAEAGQPYPPDYGTPTEREALRATVNELGLDRFDLVGWSYGGHVSLAFTLEHPERVRTLTVIEPDAVWILRALGYDPDALGQGEARDRSLTGKEISVDDLKEFLGLAALAGSGQAVESLPSWPVWVRNRQVLSTFGTIWDYTDSLERLRTLEVPVLAVKGTETTNYVAAGVDHLAALVPHGRLLALPGGHACHIENMDRFLAELASHTAGVPV